MSDADILEIVATAIMERRIKPDMPALLGKHWAVDHDKELAKAAINAYRASIGEEEVNQLSKIIRNARCEIPTYPWQVFDRGEAEANIQEWCKAAARAVLASVPHSECPVCGRGAEPAAWQHRVRHKMRGGAWGEWSEWRPDRAMYLDPHITGTQQEERALYALSTLPELDAEMGEEG